MTAAELLRPPAVPSGAVRRVPADLRLAWLHLRTRRVPTGILALAVCGSVLHAVLHWHWTFNSGPYAQQAPMTLEAGTAAVIAVTGHSPFGETERATGRRGLLCSVVTGGLSAWTLPTGYMAFCQYALLQAWRAPWTWPVRPPADRGAWICAAAAFAVGLLLFTVLGGRTRLSDDS